MTPTDRAAALRALSGLLRCGLSLREALCTWPDEVAADTRAELRSVARRARLGLSLTEVLAALEIGFEDDAQMIASGLALGIRGVNAAELAERLAAAIEDREAARASSRAASSGARLSSRMVAVLPLAFIPLATANGAPMLDGPGLLLGALGLSLLAVGLAWLRRLVPNAPEVETDSARLARATSDLLGVGLGLGPSLEIGVQLVGGADLTRALRLRRLGFPWPRALHETGIPELSRFAVVVRNCQRAGVSPATSLREFLRHTRAEQERAFERARRRAPILMVLPLALCILPGFVFLAVVPLLRSFAG
ncbi:MAG TPA: type II secretion system F family protein [Actinomycetota bacterium]|nr:type II secretion system F family protein [Actinomycetota bacterium]